MGITTRDLEIIRYCEKNFLMNADIASRLVYWTKNEASSLNIAQRRMRELFKLKQLKRVREFVGQSYTYYIGKTPTKTAHRLMMTDFLSRMVMNGFEIDLDQTESEYKELEERFGIRPDMLVTFNYADKTYQALVEIDLTKPFSNSEAYERILRAKRNGELGHLLPYPLAVISICDTKPDFNCIWIKTDWSNFSNLTYAFVK